MAPACEDPHSALLPAFGVDVLLVSVIEVFYLADRTTETNDTFTNVEINGLIGPYQEAESDFTLFCEVFTDIMG